MHKVKAKDKISRRHVSGGLTRPLDQTHCIFTEIFAKTGIIKLFWFGESIKIKVIQVYARNYVHFNQCIGRAFHRPGMSKPSQKGTSKGCFAGTEIAVEPDNHAGNQQRRQFTSKGDGRRLIRQAE